MHKCPELCNACMHESTQGMHHDKHACNHACAAHNARMALSANMHGMHHIQVMHDMAHVDDMHGMHEAQQIHP